MRLRLRRESFEEWFLEKELKEKKWALRDFEGLGDEGK